MTRRNKKYDNQQGAAALILTAILLSGLLIVGLAVALVMLSEMKLSRATGDSVIAYYGAEAGTEMALYNIRRVGGWPIDSDRNCGIDAACCVTIESGASYTVSFDSSALLLDSIGRFLDSARVIKVGI